MAMSQLPGLLTDLFVIFLQSVDAQRDRDVQIRALVQDARNVRKDPLLDLTVRHQVDRLEFVVLVKRPRDFRQVLTGERLAAGDDQDAEIGAERFADADDIFASSSAVSCAACRRVRR